MWIQKVNAYTRKLVTPSTAPSIFSAILIFLVGPSMRSVGFKICIRHDWPTFEHTTGGQISTTNSCAYLHDSPTDDQITNCQPVSGYLHSNNQFNKRKCAQNPLPSSQQSIIFNFKNNIIAKTSRWKKTKKQNKRRTTYTEQIATKQMIIGGESEKVNIA